MKIFRRKKSRQAGFTLIELMVVIVILGVLAGMIIPRIMGRPDEARQAKARIQMEAMESALKLYKLDNGSYPSTEQGLKALVEAPTTGDLPKNWRQGGYLEKGKVPKDPWETICLLKSAVTAILIYSSLGQRRSSRRRRVDQDSQWKWSKQGFTAC